MAGREVYELLDQLCEHFIRNAPINRRDLLRNTTQYFSSTPSAMYTGLPYDQNTLVAKISEKLRQPSATGNSKSNMRNAAKNESRTMLFLNSFDQLKAAKLPEEQLNAILTLLFCLENSKCNSTENGFVQTENENKNLFLEKLKYGHSSSRSQYSMANLTKETGYSGSTLFTSGGGGVSSQSARNAQTSAVLQRVRELNKVGDILQYNNNNNQQYGSTNVAEVDNFCTTTRITTKSIEITEKQLWNSPSFQLDIVQAAIYSFTGIGSELLEKCEENGKFRLKATATKMTIVQAGMLLRLSEIGYYHDKVQLFADPKSGRCAIGLMGQALISAFKTEITKYYGMVAMLQEQLNRHRHIAKQPTRFGREEKLTLMKLLVWQNDPMQRLKWLAAIGEECQEQKGGKLASILYRYMNHGAPLVKNLAKSLLITVCGPFLQMLTRWLLEGELNDQFNEFFIESVNAVGVERLWHDKYFVRTSMLPVFINEKWANKILITGKSINFLHEICEDKDPVKGKEELKQCIVDNAEDIFSCVTDTRLHTVITSIYLNTSKHVLDIAMGPHKLLEHLQAMRRYLLLGQGDFISVLMEYLKTELDKPAKELYSYDLSSFMDSAIRSTNAQYDDPEILNHLDVRLMSPCDGDIGWDILSLQYTVQGPLATMLEPLMPIYKTIFTPLWRMKHMEFVLSSVWREQKCNSKLLRSMASQLTKMLYPLHLFTSEMIHFIHQMEYYILFEVIECAWAEFQNLVADAKALDDILDAHARFLDTIKTGAFLDQESREISNHLENVYDAITRLEVWQENFYKKCVCELQAQRDFKKGIDESAKRGEFGLTTEKQLTRDYESKIFEQNMVTCHKLLEKIGSDYEENVRLVLLALNSNSDHNLQLFGTRLDFNEYYKKRDDRLNVPLTFERMRMSNVFFTGANKSIMGSRISSVN